MAEQALSAPVSPAQKPQSPARRKEATLVPRVVTGGVILIVWEFVVRALAPQYVAKPTGILLAVPEVITDPKFLTALGQTLAAVAEGLAITLVLGTVLGLAMGRSPSIDRTIRVYINGFNALPMIIVLPLFSLWFGYSTHARIATIIFAAIFAITMNVADGARAVPREYLEVSRSFRSGKFRTLIDIVLPASTPYLLAGFRLAAGRALIGAASASGSRFSCNGPRAASCRGTGAARGNRRPSSRIDPCQPIRSSPPPSRIGARASSPTASYSPTSRT